MGTTLDYYAWPGALLPPRVTPDAVEATSTSIPQLRPKEN